MGKILIIDDDPFVRNVLSKCLSKEDHQVYTAKEGREGLALLQKNHPQVIILDLKMPGMGGIEFLQQLKPKIGNPYSVIVLTGYDTDQDIEHCYQLGIQFFLRKPVNLLELKGLVQRTFELTSYALELKREIEAKEHAYQILKSTFDGMAEGVLTLDSNFRIQMISEKACRIIGISQEEALQKPAAAILGTAVAGASGVLNQQKNPSARVSEIQTRLLCPSGAVIPVSLSIVPLQQASPSVRWLLFFRDEREEERTMREKIHGGFFGQIISTDPKMKEIFQLVDNVAATNATVLIQGESGTGKELLAREIHERSRRAQKPFHAVNCAAIPDNLLESEFFGHERGSFTGAGQTKPGRFELANGGTLFLDEIGEIPFELQGKLLRALQEQSFEHVGGIKTIQVDVRIIAASSRDLQKMVDEHLYRVELYYRLDVVSFNLPPLRERPHDIPLLVSYFIKTLNKEQNREVYGISPEALKQLLHYPWPGNIRELYHGIEHAFAIGHDNLIRKKHLPEKIQNNFSQTVQESTKPKSEKESILFALEQANFHKGKTASFLGISPATLYRKRKKYQI
ncbi:MAG: sigma 54-interacting transcriptional regulator [SAR324 cluster bacterium]|nr:sigma 54-interacting transcriptional regulator [SAR324 cluster bacterium]